MRETIKIRRFEAFLPYPSISLPLILGIIATALSLKWADGSISRFLGNCAIILAIPVVIGTLLALTHQKYAGFGVFFLFFAVPYCWHRLMGIIPEKRIASAIADMP